MFILENIKTEEEYLKFIETEKKDNDYFKESQIQNMVIQWLDKNNIDFHPSFNGIKVKSIGQRAFMKRQGMRSGHPDLTIEKKAVEHEVLFLELKTIKNDLSKEQKVWCKKKISEGYAVSVSKGYYDAIYKIEKYDIRESQLLDYMIESIDYDKDSFVLSIYNVSTKKDNLPNSKIFYRFDLDIRNEGGIKIESWRLDND